jgi:hypothetical protein
MRQVNALVLQGASTADAIPLDRHKCGGLLEKEGRRVAIEVHWSAQSSFDFRKRQAPYSEAGVETILLHRNRVLLASSDIVEPYVEEIAGGRYNASITGYLGAPVSVEVYIRAALDGFLQFGLKPNDPANISVMAAEAKCWRDDCDGRFPIIASQKHLHRYLAEFDFRHNNRLALGIGDIERTINAVKSVDGKRLMYRQPH